jgi:glutamyl/glutaminyl-tRNA synthetase
MPIGRFAPSTTGHAHPGTLLAALLCWLDARNAGGEVALRLEDLDPERCRPEYADAMQGALDWLGLDWDVVQRQSECATAHAAALDQLAAAGLLYPCACSRADIRREGVRAPDGGWRYSGRCRERALPGGGAGGWRACGEALRVRLPAGRIELCDEGGRELSQDPLADYGDSVVRRRDGAIAYHLASVVDDHALGVTRIVRGEDLAGTTATQVALQRLLGLPTPAYRHHLLLLEERGGKLAKLHGSVGLPELREHYEAPELCGALAHAAGLLPEPTAVRPGDLIADFSWTRVERASRVMRWTGERLVLGEPVAFDASGAAPA